MAERTNAGPGLIDGMTADLGGPRTAALLPRLDARRRHEHARPRGLVHEEARSDPPRLQGQHQRRPQRNRRGLPLLRRGPARLELHRRTHRAREEDRGGRLRLAANAARDGGLEREITPSRTTPLPPRAVVQESPWTFLADYRLAATLFTHPELWQPGHHWLDFRYRRVVRQGDVLYPARKAVLVELRAFHNGGDPQGPAPTITLGSPEAAAASISTSFADGRTDAPAARVFLDGFDPWTQGVGIPGIQTVNGCRGFDLAP